MKKILVLMLSVILVLGLASLSMAATIVTSGEIDPEFFMGKSTGESCNYSLIEAGIYNWITINDHVTASLNFWLESDSNESQNYNFLDDAVINYQFGDNKLIVGKTRYWRLQGPVGEEFQNFFRSLLGSGEILEPAVSLIGEFKLNDNFNLYTGYFYNDTCKVYNSYDHDGYNVPFIKVGYTKGNFAANVEALRLYDPDKTLWHSEGKTPATDYMVDASYWFDKLKVWAYIAYLGVAQNLDNNYINTTEWYKNNVDKTDKFLIIGGTKNIGKLFIGVDYVVDAPESLTSSDTGSINWAEDHPYGFTLAYDLGNNTTLKYQYMDNTGNWSDKNFLRLIVKF